MPAINSGVNTDAVEIEDITYKREKEENIGVGWVRSSISHRDENKRNFKNRINSQSSKG